MHLIEQNRHENVRQVWLRTIKKVYDEGERIVDQRGNNVIRLHNVAIEINQTWLLKYTIENSKLENAFLDNLINPSPNDFDYTYGDRLHEGNQLGFIKKELQNNVDSRRCVATLFNYYDMSRSIQDGKEVPCCTQLHFQHFRNKLHLNCIMRSNDIVGALPADMYGFGNLLNLVAEELRISRGTFTYHIIDAHIILEHYEEKLKELGICR